MRRGGRIAAAACLAGWAAGCGKASPSLPSNEPCATVTISANAATPNAVTVSPGCRVLFVNRDSVPHEMSSDPHPEHTDCPPLNVGLLSAGAQRETSNLVSAGACGFHDHLRPQVNGLRGTISIR